MEYRPFVGFPLSIDFRNRSFISAIRFIVIKSETRRHAPALRLLVCWSVGLLVCWFVSANPHTLSWVTAAWETPKLDASRWVKTDTIP